MKKPFGFAVFGILMSIATMSQAETRRVCDAGGHCRDLIVSPACRNAVDQYTGQACVFGNPGRGQSSPPPAPGCGPGGINQYTGRPC